MNSLEFIKLHIAEWPSDDCRAVILYDNGLANFYHLEVGQMDVSIDLSEHFAPSYYDGKVWKREEFESYGKTSPVEGIGTTVEECDRHKYKRGMMLQLVTNERLTSSSVSHDRREMSRYVQLISRLADELTEEAFK